MNQGTANYGVVNKSRCSSWIRAWLMNRAWLWCVCVCVCVCVCAQSCLTLQPRRLWPTRLLCLWNFPGKNTGVGCHFLLQGIFTQKLNLCLLHLLHCRQILYCWPGKTWAKLARWVFWSSGQSSRVWTLLCKQYVKSGGHDVTKADMGKMV